MQVPRENFYEAIVGNPLPIKVQAWWTSSPCAKRGIVVQTLSYFAESSCMGKGKWVQKVIARSDLVARWKMWCPACSWGVWHSLGLGSNCEQPVKRRGRRGRYETLCPCAALLPGNMGCCCFRICHCFCSRIYLWMKGSGSSGHAEMAEMALKSRSLNLVI